MRRLICQLLLLLCWSRLASAETLRVTTWNLNWFPSGSPDSGTPEQESRHINDVAAVLNRLAPDVIVLQEVRDWDTCERLAAAMSAHGSKVLLCSNFKEGRAPALSKRQIAILSRLPVESSWSQEWRGRGWVKPPGGYAFAAVRAGATTIGIFGVHLKNNLVQGPTGRETQLNILKRELSAEQLIEEIDQIQYHPRHRLDAVVVAGNFNTNSDQDAFVSENTLASLHSAGLKSVFDGWAPVARVTSPGTSRYPSATFDYVFVRDADFALPALITNSKLSDHYPVTCAVTVTPRPLLPMVDQAAGASVPARSISTRWMWFMALLTAGVIGMLWHTRRQPLTAAVMLPAPDSAATNSREAGSEANGWMVRTVQAEQQAAQATAVVRAGLIPHLARLMADRLVRKLFWQRANLIETQRATATHVAELEQRLSQLQPKLQVRLDAYERRIAELEHELETSRKKQG